MTGLEDRNDDNLVNMICGIYCENNPFIKIENIKEEILSRLKEREKLVKKSTFGVTNWRKE